jgi:hypothetical protein
VTAILDQKLDTLAFSPTCKSYLQKDKRKVECYDFIRYGEILGARMWTISGTTKTATNISSSGYSYCKSKSINIEGLVNDCVGTVDFLLNGPNGYFMQNHDFGVPHTLFGDSGTMLFGLVLPHVGKYSITITPDTFMERQKTFNFTANNC